MKLAEALLLRAEYQTKIEELQKRILVNIRVQEGEKPKEEPNELIKEVCEINNNLKELINKINKSNNATILENNVSLSEALVEREAVLKERSILASIVDMASNQDYRLTRAEIKMLTTVNISEIHKRIDKLSKEFRELDTKIQAKNWTVDI